MNELAEGRTASREEIMRPPDRPVDSARARRLPVNSAAMRAIATGAAPTAADLLGNGKRRFPGTRLVKGRGWALRRAERLEEDFRRSILPARARMATPAALDRPENQNAATRSGCGV
ncbi:MAG TPA: hypothetical protein VEB66_02465 [Opitutaceae bacterium]|nr:hypothetical protein [Opitutaceae bacterium]